MAEQKQSTWNHNKLYSPSWGEEKLMLVFVMDVMGGGLRDWYEELQD